MKQLFLLITFVAVSVLLPVFAQTRQKEIKKIVFFYHPGFWSAERPVTYELFPNGNIKLYNDHYDTASSFDRLVGRQLEAGENTQIEISADKLREIVNRSSSYYEGNIGTKMFEDLSNSIFQHINDTTKNNGNRGIICGSDVPYGEIKVFYRENAYFRFNYCFQKDKDQKLFDAFYDIAYLKGFKSTKTKFEIDNN